MTSFPNVSDHITRLLHDKHSTPFMSTLHVTFFKTRITHASDHTTRHVLLDVHYTRLWTHHTSWKTLYRSHFMKNTLHVSAWPHCKVCSSWKAFHTSLTIFHVMCFTTTIPHVWGHITRHVFHDKYFTHLWSHYTSGSSWRGNHMSLATLHAVFFVTSIPRVSEHVTFKS